MKIIKKLLPSLMLVIIAATFANSQTKTQTAPDFKGIQYAFDRAKVPDYDKKAIFVVFFGYGKPGWNAKKQQNYPLESRRVFSKIYRLDNLPESC